MIYTQTCQNLAHKGCAFGAWSECTVCDARSPDVRNTATADELPRMREVFSDALRLPVHAAKL